MANQSDNVIREQYLTFFVGGEEYAVGILRVREIIEYDVLTKIPSAPPAIRGVINLRGNVVPVVDLALRLGMAETATTKWTCIVIVDIVFDTEPVTMGVMADSVSQVIDLGANDIEPPPTFGTRIDLSYLTGMARSDKKFILLIDLDKILTDLVATPGLESVAGTVEAEPSEAPALAQT